MKLLRDMVLIQADPEEKRTASGLHIAREWKKLPQTGKVLGIGPEVEQVKPQNRVHFNRYAFTPMGGDKFIGAEKNINMVLGDGENT